MKNTKLGSVQIYYSAYNKAAVLEKKLTIVLSLMQLITVTILRRSRFTTPRNIHTSLQSSQLATLFTGRRLGP